MARLDLPEQRLFVGTRVGCTNGQRVWKRQPAGGFAGLGMSPSSTMRLRARSTAGSGIGHRREQRRVYGCSGLSYSVVGRRDLDDLAEVHHGDPVGDVADDREVVGDEEIRQAEPLLQLLEQVDDLRLDRDVERRHRLVGRR